MVNYSRAPLYKDPGKVDYRPDDIFKRYPKIGTTKHMSPDSAGADANALIYLGAGNQGVIRNISTVGFADAWAYLQPAVSNVHLRIYTDAGDIADRTSPPVDHLVADIPLHTLFSANYGTTDFAENTGRLTQHYKVFADTADGAYNLQLNLPIPFANGVLVQIWNGDTLGTQGVYNVNYELGTLPSYWEDWRLRCATLEASIADNATGTFLTVASGAGVLAGLFASMDGAADVGGCTYAEDGIKFKLDGESTPSIVWAGIEDMTGIQSSYFWAPWSATTWNFSPTEGTPYFNAATDTVEWFKWFDEEPVWWANGIIGYWTNTSAYEAAVAVKMAALFYGPVAPS